MLVPPHAQLYARLGVGFAAASLLGATGIVTSYASFKSLRTPQLRCVLYMSCCDIGKVAADTHALYFRMT